MDQRLLSPLARRLATTASAAIVIVLGAAVWVAFGRVRADGDLVAHSREVIRSGDDVLQRLTDAEAGQRGYVITADSAYLSPYRGAKGDVAAAVRRLRALTDDDSLDRRHVDTLEALAARRLAVLDERIAIRRTAGFDSARRAIVTGRGLALMARARLELALIEAREDSLLARRRVLEAHEVRLLLAILLLGSLAAATVAVLLNHAFARYAAAARATARALAVQNGRLRDQADELELQHGYLEEQATELECQANQLHEQATELQAANESLAAAAAALRERSETAERLRRDAETANRAKSDFLAVMSHELRTPLNAIAGYVDLLKLGVHGPLAAEQLRDLERIERNGGHLLSLINDVLSFAKIEVGRVDLRLAPLCVGALVGTLEPLVAPQMTAGGLTYAVLRACGDGSCGAFILADEERLRQIILNLLTNAIKFTPPGGRATVRCDCDREHVRIRVSDTGRGIPPDKLAAIFEPFVQVDRHLNREGQEGVGLGLAISRELAHRMGGELTVESRVGEGSTFTLRFERASAPVLAPDLALPLDAVRATPSTMRGTSSDALRRDAQEVGVEHAVAVFVDVRGEIEQEVRQAALRDEPVLAGEHLVEWRGRRDLRRADADETVGRPIGRGAGEIRAVHVHPRDARRIDHGRHVDLARHRHEVAVARVVRRERPRDPDLLVRRRAVERRRLRRADARRLDAGRFTRGERDQREHRQDVTFHADLPANGGRAGDSATVREAASWGRANLMGGRRGCKADARSCSLGEQYARARQARTSARARQTRAQGCAASCGGRLACAYSISRLERGAGSASASSRARSASDWLGQPAGIGRRRRFSCFDSNVSQPAEWRSAPIASASCRRRRSWVRLRRPWLRRSRPRRRSAATGSTSQTCHVTPFASWNSRKAMVVEGVSAAVVGDAAVDLGKRNARSV